MRNLRNICAKAEPHAYQIEPQATTQQRQQQQQQQQQPEQTQTAMKQLCRKGDHATRFPATLLHSFWAIMPYGGTLSWLVPERMYIGWCLKGCTFRFCKACSSATSPERKRKLMMAGLAETQGREPLHNKLQGLFLRAVEASVKVSAVEAMRDGMRSWPCSTHLPHGLRVQDEQVALFLHGV